MYKINLIFAGLILLFNCQGQTTKNSQSLDIKKLNWLEGTWDRTNARPGRSGHERWEKTSPTEWKGWGVSLNGADTSLLEKIKIIERDKTIYYVADVPENTEPVYFTFTSLTQDSFVCENPEHDFPKKIEYRLEQGILKATISGDGKSIPYLFKKRP